MTMSRRTCGGSAPAVALLLACTARLGVARLPTGVTYPADMCPGSIELKGYGTVEMVSAQLNVAGEPAGKAYVEDGRLVPYYKSRAYFADACTPGTYNSTEYIALPLLGRSMTFTTDLSEAGCGCSVAFYMTNLHQNKEVSNCNDSYCDANTVCGVACHEIDIMEANRFAFRTSLHSEDDAWGLSVGYGGEVGEWTGSQYGPDGECINTSFPFQVTTDFPVNSQGDLEAMIVTLSQAGKPCNLTVILQGYDGNSTIPGQGKGSGHGMVALSEGLRAGMTPMASLWGADDMGWMDGVGIHGTGPCKEDAEDNCPEKVEMYDFYLEELPPPGPNYVWFLGVLAVILGMILFVVVSKAVAGKKGGKKGEKILESDESADSESSS